MEHQTVKQEELYVERAAYGEAFLANGTPFAIGNNQLIDGKLRAVVSLLSHGRCKGASRIRTEHIKACLQGAKRPEDQETAVYHVRAGKMCCEFVCLCSSVWTTGTIPQHMCWVITVLIPKERGGLLGHWLAGANLEGAQKGDGPQAGGNRLA